MRSNAVIKNTASYTYSVESDTVTSVFVCAHSQGDRLPY